MPRTQVLLGAALAAWACAPARREPEPPRPPGVVEPDLPPIPRREGPLALDLVHPPEGGEVTVRDSTFVFGSTGTGDARLTINGFPVRVEPNGAFLAFLPVPTDGLYRLEATTPRGEAQRLERQVAVPPPPPTVPPGRATIVAGSTYPRGARAALPGERIEVGFRGTPGGVAALVLPDGTRVPLVEDGAAADAAGIFEVSPQAARAPAPGTPARYRGYFVARRGLLAADTALPRPTLARIPADAEPDTMREKLTAAAAAGDLRPGADSLATPPRPHAPAPGGGETGATFELVLGTDTARAPLRLNLAVLDPGRPPVGVAADTAPPGGVHDGYVVGQPGPGTTEHYFWPNRTRFTLTGERDGSYRVRLAEDLSAWVPAGEVRLLPRGTPPPGGAVGPVRLTPTTGYVDVRVSLPERLPFHVDVGERSLTLTVFGGMSNTDWIFYGATDPLIERVEWSQPSDSSYRLIVHLTQPPWGYRASWADGPDLLLRVRRPPAIDRRRPLRGLLIALDPGHPPGGAIGPTRLTEAEANLAIALRLRDLLERAGARVLMTRADMSAVGLYDRPVMATRAGADIFVSIHNNAFPDGVNPFENNGTSVYYFHPHSVELARALQLELLDELELRDLGIGRSSLAVVRWPTWFPSALTESMFLMIPQQEAALRNPEVQERIARAHLRALEDFVRR